MLADSTRSQISDWRIGRTQHRPLVICDADEVLLRFVATLELFLEEQGLYLDLRSFALTGNIRRRDGGAALESDEVRALLRRFFSSRIAECPPVEGAVEALAEISRDSDVVVLTNLPAELRTAREKALRDADLPFPVIANEGRKGPAVMEMTNGATSHLAFVDDLPPNIASVAEHAGHVHRIHFVADPRLARLLDPAPGAHARIDDWGEAARYLLAYFEDEHR